MHEYKNRILDEPSAVEVLAGKLVDTREPKRDEGCDDDIVQPVDSPGHHRGMINMGVISTLRLLKYL